MSVFMTLDWISWDIREQSYYLKGKEKMMLTSVSLSYLFSFHFLRFVFLFHFVSLGSFFLSFFFTFFIFSFLFFLQSYFILVLSSLQCLIKNEDLLITVRLWVFVRLRIRANCKASRIHSSSSITLSLKEIGGLIY